MKRPASFSIPHLAVRGRKRALSEEERALWESVARQVKPLRKKPRLSKAQSAEPSPEPAVVHPKPLPKALPSIAASKPSKPAIPPLAPLNRRERSRLSRGRDEIEARLDLHGMTQVRAHRALLRFLQRAHDEGLTFVLVITGKGTVGESERGVLRRQVPQWLSLPEFRGFVVGFEQAHVGHGGEGALYVRIRRARG
jgi:DNA-nicking Smr family endonuclease